MNSVSRATSLCGERSGPPAPAPWSPRKRAWLFTYGLNHAQQRGLTFVEPGTPVYEGMIVGAHARDSDLAVNVCKRKEMTNMRASRPTSPSS